MATSALLRISLCETGDRNPVLFGVLPKITPKPPHRGNQARSRQGLTPKKPNTTR